MNFKTVLLAAAALGVAGTAQAADLAKKAPAAANYVKVCDAYGAGFFYIPGTETCLKISGYAQAQYNMYWHSKNGSLGGGIYGWHRGENGISTGARGVLEFDARSNTEMGLLRSFIGLEANNNSYGVSNGIALKKAFVQFGGLTAGRATSFFDFWTGYTTSAFLEAAHSDANVNLLAYTFAFGNGISATVSIEDPSTTDDSGRRATYYVAGSTTYTGPYGGVHTPDLVGNVNISQAWGSAQIMGVLHDDVSRFDGVNGKLGFAIGAGVQVNLPALGPSTALALQASYGKGALAYVSPSFDTSIVDFGVAGGSVRQNNAWAIAGGLTHGFTKTITGNLEASYAQYRTDSVLAKGDFNQWDVQGNLTWSPVKNLAIIAELEYRNVDFSSAATAAGVGAGAGGANINNDYSALIGVLRVKRSF